MVSEKTVVLIVNLVNLSVASLLLVLCMSNIWRFIFKMGIHKKFVNMFYVSSLLILVSYIGLSISLLIEDPD